MSDKRIARSAGLTGSATLASRILGLVRDQVLAAMFGAGSQMDAFIVAFRIPNLVRDLFAEGALSAAFVPTFTTYLTRRSRADAWRLGNNVLNTLIVLTGVLVVCGVIFARPLVTFYAGDYGAVPGKLELTVFLTRIMLPFLTLAALAAGVMGMLNSLHHYFVPALAPATFNVATILGAFILVPLMPLLGLPGITAIAVAAIIGGIAQLALQWPPLRREGFRYRPFTDLRDPGLHRVLLLMGPGTIGLAATQLNLFVNTLLATSQGTGAVSWLAYAFRLMYLPIGLFGVSIATAVLPVAALHAARDNPAAIRDALSRGLGLMLVLNIPATLGLFVLATPIVRVLFERGQFLPADTTATAAALQMYAVGLVGYSTARIAAPVYYAIGQSRMPVVVSAASMAVNIVSSLLLVKKFGFLGLALGTSIAALAHGGAALFLLRRHLPGIDGRRLASKCLRVTVAAIAMATVATATEQWASGVIPGGSLALQSARLALAISTALAALVVSAKLLRIPEIDEAAAAARAALQRTRSRRPPGA